LLNGALVGLVAAFGMYVVATFQHSKRKHQGLQNGIIQPGAEVGKSQGAIGCRNRLGCMLRYYYRMAA
jgi:hypothetical protein